MRAESKRVREGGTLSPRFARERDDYLLFRGYALEGLLYDPAAVHLEREREDVPLHLEGQRLLLLLGAELKELLDDVVAEHVRHQAVRRAQDLVEHQLLLDGGGTLELLLDEPATNGPLAYSCCTRSNIVRNIFVIR